MFHQECDTVSGSFELLESLLFDGEYFLLDKHLARLAGSAGRLGFNVDLDRVRQLLLDEAPAGQGRPMKVRLLVDREGMCRLDCQPLKPPDRIRIALARDPIDKEDLFLYHKTTHRLVYDRAKSLRPDADDVLLWNNCGEITETTVGNIVFELDGTLVTPPVGCGLLPGTMRADLLEKGAIEERVIHKQDISRAGSIYLINSVRKWAPADLTE